MTREAWPPADAEPLTSFVVVGMPKGAGSKNPIPLGRWKIINGARRFVPICRPDGTPIVNLVDSTGDAGKAWRAMVQAAADEALGEGHELWDGPIAVRVTFYHAGPKGRYGTGRNAGILKAGADRYPHRSELSDGSKLARALEDALTAVAWTDDRRVCDLWWSRRFGPDAGAVVDLFAMPREVEVSDTIVPAGQLALS